MTFTTIMPFASITPVMFEFIRLAFCFIHVHRDIQHFHCMSPDLRIYFVVLLSSVMGYTAEHLDSRNAILRRLLCRPYRAEPENYVRLYINYLPSRCNLLSVSSNHHCRLARHSFRSRFRFRVLVCTESSSCLQRFMLGQSVLSYRSSIELSRLMGKPN